MNKFRYVRSKIALIGFIILYMLMPVVGRICSIYLTTYFYMAVTALLVFRILFAQRQHTLNIYVTLIFPFLLYSLLSWFARTESILIWGYQRLLFVLPVLLGYYIVQYEISASSNLTIAVVVAIGITMLTTAVGLVKYPLASRILATIASSQDERIITYDLHNIGGYEFVYTIVLLYPLVILAYKKKRIPLIVAVGISVSILAVIILSEYTTALLLFILSSFLFFMKRDMRAKEIVIFAIVGIAALLFLEGYVSDFLKWLATLLESNSMVTRLNDLAGGTATLETSEDNRIFMYRASIDTFLAHPIFGTFLSGNGRIGGHSFVLDSLGQYGLIGGTLLFYMYRTVYRRFIKPFQSEMGYGYILWFFFQAILLSSVNTGMWLNVLTLYGLVILCWIYKKGKPENGLN